MGVPGGVGAVVDVAGTIASVLTRRPAVGLASIAELCLRNDQLTASCSMPYGMLVITIIQRRAARHLDAPWINLGRLGRGKSRLAYQLALRRGASGLGVALAITIAFSTVDGS